jgi:ATP:ADP antiporter, AAA family
MLRPILIPLLLISKDYTIMKTEQKSWFRETFFPIYGVEIKRFLPMALMMFFILFNYTILRNVKDTLVTNGRGADAEIISFIKLWGTMPAAILFVVIYSKLANILSRQRIFYIMISFFLVFFASFAFIIYPNLDTLHPSAQTIHNMQAYYPNFKMFIAMWGNWTYCLFYVLAELWGSAILSLFFWQLANETTLSNEAKRFYPLFGVIGNLGLIVAGRATKYFSNMSASLPATVDPWQVSLNYLMSAIVISGFVVIALYYVVNKRTSSEEAAQTGEAKPKKKSKPKLGIIESFKYIFTSRHLLCIAFLVLAYGITMNYIDVLWKGQVKLLSNGNNNETAKIFGNFSEITGYLAICLMFVGGTFLRKFGWYKSAVLVPLVLMAASLVFFGVIIYGNMMPAGEPVMILFGLPVTAVYLAAQIGTWSGAFTKASKYSLFDSTKEMAYIPLDDELRSKGKAAVDVTGGRMGKSGGSATIFALKTLMPNASLPSLAPYLAGLSLVIITGWIICVGKLNKSLNKLNGEAEAEEQKVSDDPSLQPQTAK